MRSDTSGGVALRLQHLLHSITSALLAFSGAVLGLLLVALVSIAFADVVLRYLMGSGWAWSGTVSVILLLWLAWLGAGHLWLADAHIAVTLTGPRTRTRLMRFFGLVVIGAGLVLVPMALQTMQAYSFIDLPVLGLTAASKYVPIAVGTVYLITAAFLSLLAGLLPDPEAQR